MKSVMNWFSRRVAHPLWDMKDGSQRLRELSRLEKTQWLPESALREIQADRLRRILVHAYDNSPYYRSLFDRNSLDATKLGPQQMSRIPVLTKQDVRTHVDAMIARPYVRETLPFHKTGGSTGTALTTYFNEEWREVRTADALRANQWANYFHGMKVAAVWGNPPVPATLKQKLRSALYDRFMFLDTMNLTDSTLNAFVVQWRREKPEIVFGHSHSICILARYLNDHGITDLRPKGVIATSMMLLQGERLEIERAFSCKVNDRYGCEEVGLIASQCELHAAYHLDIEHLYIEFIRPDGTDAAPGEEGAIVITDLLNMAMPLIRYRVEDVGVPSKVMCKCGRGMPTMDRVTGRVADYLRRRDGSQVAGVSLVERTLTAIPGVDQMQIVQTSLEEIQLNVVIAEPARAAADEALRKEFTSVFGDIVITINHVARIPQEASGKYRFSICRIPG
jgi:phenylacetate-CoA ligase